MKAAGAVPGRAAGPVLCQHSWHSPAPSVGAHVWPRGCARPSLEQELLGDMQTLDLGSQRCSEFCLLQGLTGIPSLSRPSVSVSLSLHTEYLPSLPPQPPGPPWSSPLSSWGRT